MGLICEGTSGIDSMSGFDVQIGTVHISVNMKLFQDKCVAVTVMVQEN